MKAVLQRVLSASVEVDAQVVGAIQRGWLVFLGVEVQDQKKDLDFICDKILNLRCFKDEAQKMNLSALDCSASILMVSQFTLAADCRRGRRPSFAGAAPPAEAETIYRDCIETLRKSGLEIAAGVFGADMKVHIVNDGPVTIVLDSKLVHSQ